MFSVNLFKSLVLVILISLQGGRSETNCDGGTESCQGSRMARFITRSVHRLNENNSSLEIIPGLEIVKSLHQSVDHSRSNDVESNSLLSELHNYIYNHELKIKFKELLGSVNLGTARSFINTFFQESPVEEGRKKDKGGMGMMMMMGLMMTKMMTTIGIGGIAALAFKALGVSTIALLLSGMLGLKKLMEGQGESGHHVQYVTAHESHHRRKREIDGDNLPYRGWGDFISIQNNSEQ